jgi:hypothetical protein
MPHFFAADLLGFLVAFAFGIPLFILPGYLIGWSLNLLRFRESEVNWQWSKSLVLGVTVVPILAYLPFRLFSATSEMVVLALLSTAGGALAVRNSALPRWRDVAPATIVAASIWILLVGILSFDIAVGHRLYPSSSIIDTSVRSQVVASISQAEHLPPSDFFHFNPQRPSFLQYHYFGFILAAAVQKSGGHWLSASSSLAAITAWVGLSFIIVFVLFVTRFSAVASEGRIPGFIFLLPLIGGLDILPVGAAMIRRMIQGQWGFPIPDVEWWNGYAQVFGWVDTAIWHPHHIAGLCACLVGCLILWESREASGTQRWKSCVGAGLCFASGAGISALVTIVFACFLLVVTVELLLNSSRHAWILIGSGLLSLLLISPFVFELNRHQRRGSSPLTSPFEITVRPFEPVDSVLRTLDVNSSLAWNLAHLLALPVNYLMELGFFFVVGIVWLYDYKRNGTRDIFRAHVQIGLLATSMVLVTFVAFGTASANDFGYRGILPAQFVLLLWAAEVINRHEPMFSSWRFSGGPVAKIVLVTAVLGISTTLLGFVMMRGTIGRTGAGLDRYYATLRGPQPSERLYDLREAYLWIKKNTPEGSVVEENPMTVESLSAHYGERRAAVYSWFDKGQTIESDGKSTLLFDNAMKLFTTGATIEEMKVACRNGKIDYIVSKNNDEAWFDRNSYIWKEKPIHSLRSVKVFRCSETQ